MGEGVHARVAIVACLGFSGFSALVYQVLWTRLLGFAFGTTTEAIGTVLAVFFGGLALGNLLAARWLARCAGRSPSTPRSSSGSACFALASLPLLQGLGQRSRTSLAASSRRPRARRCGCRGGRRPAPAHRRDGRDPAGGGARPGHGRRHARARERHPVRLEHARRRPRGLSVRLLDDPGARSLPLGADRRRRQPRRRRGGLAGGPPRRAPHPSGTATARPPSQAAAQRAAGERSSSNRPQASEVRSGLLLLAASRSRASSRSATRSCGRRSSAS